MQCDDDPLSQFTYENGNNCWDEEGAKSRDNNLLQLSTDVEEDGISKRSFQREKCGGGGGVEGSHLSDIRLQNAQSCSSIDRRSLGAEDSSGGDTNTKKSFGNASSSSSTFVPFGSYALGQHRVHHMEQNVDYQQSTSLILPFQYPHVEQQPQPPATCTPPPPPPPSMYASQPCPLRDVYNTADNYPGPMPASVMNLPNVPVHENSRSTTTLSSGRGNVLSHGLSSSHPRSARYQSFSGFTSPAGPEISKQPGHLIGGNRSLLNIHNFCIHTFTKPTLCDVCGNLLIGLVSQGYKCIICGMNVHEKCQQILCSPEHKYCPPSKSPKSQVQTELLLPENKILLDPCDEVWHKHLLRSNQNWVPDRAALSCMICSYKFTLFIRKHHCRRCGACVCGSCSASSISAKVLSAEHKRHVNQQHSMETMAADGGSDMRRDWKSVSAMQKLAKRVATTNWGWVLPSPYSKYDEKSKGSARENDAAALRTCTRCTRIVDQHISSELQSAGYYMQHKSKKQQPYESNNSVGSGWQGQAYPPTTQNKEYPNFAEMRRHKASQIVYSGSNEAASAHLPKYPPPNYGDHVVTTTQPNVVDHLSSNHGPTTTMGSYESIHRDAL
eukprot:161052_1